MFTEDVEMAINAVSAGATPVVVSPESQATEVTTKPVERKAPEAKQESSSESEAAIVELSGSSRAQPENSEAASSQINFTAVIEEGGEEIVPHPAQVTGGPAPTVSVGSKGITAETVHSSSQEFTGYDDKGHGKSSSDSHSGDTGGNSGSKEQLNTYA